MTTNVYVSSVAWNAVAPWAANTAKSLGDYVRQLAAPGYGNERVFKCTTAGTTHATTEPTWSKNNNATTSDGSVTWTQVGGQEAEQAAGNWKAPLANIAVAATLITAGTGVRLFVSNDHAETSSAASDIDCGNCDFVISVSRLGASLPPVNADYLRGAKVDTTGASNITIRHGQFFGIDFTAGSGASGANITCAQGNFSEAYLEDCSLKLGNTNSGSVISVESTETFPGSTRLKKTPMIFGAAGQGINIAAACLFEWYDTPSGAISGTVPTTLFLFPSNTPGRMVSVHGLDLSSLNTNLFSSSRNFWPTFEMWDCKLHASLTLPAAGEPQGHLAYFRMVNCDDSTNARNYRFFYRGTFGLITQDIEAIVTGGASDGVTAYSHRYSMKAHGGSSPAGIGDHLSGPWMSRRYNTTGASKTLTIEAISFHTALPTDKELWLEVEALTTSGVPLASLLSTRQVSPLGAGTGLTTSTKAWDTGAAARQNSHAYATGDTIKVASNPDRLFRVINTGGTSAGSEPGGFASAVDGDSITDGGAIFRTGNRVKFQLTFTPAVKGIVRVRVCSALPEATFGTTFNVDPKLSLA